MMRAGRESPKDANFHGLCKALQAFPTVCESTFNTAHTSQHLNQSNSKLTPAAKGV